MEAVSNVTDMKITIVQQVASEYTRRYIEYGVVAASMWLSMKCDDEGISDAYIPVLKREIKTELSKCGIK